MSRVYVVTHCVMSNLTLHWYPIQWWCTSPSNTATNSGKERVTFALPCTVYCICLICRQAGCIMLVCCFHSTVCLLCVFTHTACLYQGQAMTHVHNGEMLQVTQTGNGVNE